MDRNCESYRKLLMDHLADELEPADESALQDHLKECATCRQEKEELAALFQKLGVLEDEAVPRHFFVYPAEAGLSLRQAWQQHPLMWRAAAVAVALLVVFLSGLMATNVQVRLEDGVATIACGRALPPAIDAEELRAESMRQTRQQLEEAHEQWQKHMLGEWENWKSSLSREQKRQIAAALTDYERRMNRSVRDQMLMTRAQMEDSLDNVYETLRVQHERDVHAIGTQFNRILLQDRLEREQTKSILASLIEVVEQ